MAAYAIKSKNRVFAGTYFRITHQSTATQTPMTFGLFMPSCHVANVEGGKKDNNVPVMYWLSGLTCDDTNFAMKAGGKAFSTAEKEGIAIVMPDTSPRGDSSVPNVDSYDLGIGAGFYVDATQEPYSKHYKMYTYITEELPALLENEFSIGKYNLRSICGHSMGGHGALTIALKNPSSWVSVSAFSPICNPTACPWGDKAFKAYFGEVEAGKSHDATCLLGALDKPTSFDDILIDQGDADEFLAGQLQPESLVESAKKSGQKLSMNMREGFDHSYYFIVSFIEDHVAFHGQRLRMKQCGSK